MQLQQGTQLQPSQHVKAVTQAGLEITCSEESLIHIENGKGRVINFDIPVPMEKEAVYTCQFVHDTELASASMDVGMMVSVNTAYCLL
jgi:hypothetical protein